LSAHQTGIKQTWSVSQVTGNESGTRVPVWSTSVQTYCSDTAAADETVMKLILQTRCCKSGVDIAAAS